MKVSLIRNPGDHLFLAAKVQKPKELLGVSEGDTVDLPSDVGELLISARCAEVVSKNERPKAEPKAEPEAKAK